MRSPLPLFSFNSVLCAHSLSLLQSGRDRAGDMAQWMKAFVSKFNVLSPILRTHVEVEKEVCMCAHTHRGTHRRTHTSVTSNERKNSVS